MFFVLSYLYDLRLDKRKCWFFEGIFCNEFRMNTLRGFHLDGWNKQPPIPLGNDRQKGKGKDNGSSRFPLGMTDREAGPGRGSGSHISEASFGAPGLRLFLIHKAIANRGSSLTAVKLHGLAA